MKATRVLRPAMITSSFRLSEKSWKALDDMAKTDRRSKTIILEEMISNEIKRREGRKKAGNEEEK